MADRASRRSFGLVVDAVLRLLILLSAAFLVYEVGLRPTVGIYHPLYRYWEYLRDLLTFQPGVTSQGVQTSFYIRPALVRSLALFVAAMLASLACGFLLARWNFVRFRERAIRRLERVGSLAYSLPIAVLATLLFAFASETGWFPVGGTSSARFDMLGPLERAVDLLRHFVLPFTTLALFPSLVLLRSGMQVVEELRSSEYVTIARSHGFTDAQLFAYHVRRPLLARLFSNLASSLPLFVTYLVIVELAFRYTGVGYFMVQPYTGFWGMRREEAFVVAQAALVYVGALTVVLQLAFRLAGLWLVPSLRTAGPSDAARLSRAVVAVTLVVLCGALAVPLVAGSGAASAASRAVAAVALAGVIGAVSWASVARLHLPSLVERATATPLAASAAAGSPTRPTQGTSRTPATLRRSVGPLLAAIAVAALVVLPWVVPVPDRPGVTILIRPNVREHPFLIWYFFRLALSNGRFLLVVLITALGGSVAGSLLGIFAGYYRTTALDRAMDYVHVFPSILIAVLVAGLTEVPGAPLLVALVFAAVVRFYGESRDFGIRLRGADHVRYGRAIGEGPVELLVRHIAPNLLRGYPARLVDLSVDLIVLTANLSFLNLVSVGAAAGPPARVARFASVLTSEWGSMLAGARSDFIKGVYLPSIWPSVLLIGSIVLIRFLASSWRSR